MIVKCSKCHNETKNVPKHLADAPWQCDKCFWANLRIEESEYVNSHQNKPLPDGRIVLGGSRHAY